jgi:hypothetical protein
MVLHKEKAKAGEEKDFPSPAFAAKRCLSLPKLIKAQISRNLLPSCYPVV